MGSLVFVLVFLSANVAPVAADPVRANNLVFGMMFIDRCEVQTTGDDLRVRKVPEGNIIGKLSNGSRVNVTNRWSKISATVKGKFINGWVASSFLNEGYVETDGDNLNVRSLPPTGAIVGKLPNNTLVKTLDTWANISFKNGWVSSEFLGNCE